jgi:tetratricopeptide (TPR) repeat protein
VLPPGHNTLASALLSLSNLHFKRQEYDKAEALLVEALESCIQTYGEDSPSVANILAAQSDLAEARQNRDEAERLCLAAMAMRRRTLPPDHPDIAASLRQLAGIRATQSRNDDTLRLLHQALEIQRVNGASDYEACETILNLATYEFMAGRMDEAARLARQALTLMTRLLGEDHPSVLTTKGRLAKFLEAASDFEGALPVRLDVLARMRALPNHEPLRVAAAMDSAGVTLTRLGRYAEAEPYLREALELRLRDLGAEHFATAVSMLHLGACLALQSRFDEAEPMLLAAEVIWTEHSASAPQTREARQALVDLYRAWDRPEHLAHWEAKSARRPNAGGPASQPAATPRS